MREEEVRRRLQAVEEAETMSSKSIAVMILCGRFITLHRTVAKPTPWGWLVWRLGIFFLFSLFSVCFRT
jgi:membrane protein DedA with SNARE-associated domain